MSELTTLLNKIKVESQIKSLTCDITAQIAETILNKYNINTNRLMTKALVDRYASEMLRGEWKLNGEQILFGIKEDGSEVLISGQHRLAAIIRTNMIYRTESKKYPNATITLHSVVTYGTQVETADTVDIGRTRTHSDVLFRDSWITKHISEEWNKTPSRRNKWCRVLATAARVVWLRSGGATISSAPKFVISEMLNFIKNDHEQLTDFTNEILSIIEKSTGNIKMPIPYCIGLSYVACLNNDGTVDDETYATVMQSLTLLATATAKPNSTEFALLQYWLKLLKEPGSKDRDLEWSAPFIKALCAILKNKKLTPQQIELTQKEKTEYSKHPILFEGWDTTRYEYVAKQKSELIALLTGPKILMEIPLNKYEKQPQIQAPKKEIQNKFKATGTLFKGKQNVLATVNKQNVLANIDLKRPMIKKKPK